MVVSVKTLDAGHRCEDNQRIDWERFEVVASCGHTYNVILDTDDAVNHSALYERMVKVSEGGCVNCHTAREVEEALD